MQRSLSFAQARREIARMLGAVAAPGTESVALADAQGLILAHDLIANHDVPAFANSAMDGYALRGGDLLEGLKHFRMIGRQLAGHVGDLTAGQGECVRVTTGSVMPAGTDTVVIQENSHRDGDLIDVLRNPARGANVRPAGGDLVRGQRVLRAGTRCNAAQLGVIATLGLAQIEVFARLKVAHFSTGDELRPLGEPLKPGQIYDSNSVALAALLKSDGLAGSALAPVCDDLNALRERLKQALAQAPVVLTTGGASVGEADFLLQLLGELGQVHIAQVQMRPGLPFIAASAGAAVVFALPGNPVSVMACYRMLLSAALERRSGARPQAPLRLRAILDEALNKSHRRREFMRGIYKCDLNGRLRVRTTGSQSSQVLSSMARANCLIVLPEGELSLPIGATVLIEPL